MPGSVTIGHFHPTVTLGHDDADQLAGVLAQLSVLLEGGGPDRLTDDQVSTLCGGEPEHRAELAEWTRQLTRRVHDHL
jgi:hypothetical protein